MNNQIRVRIEDPLKTKILEILKQNIELNSNANGSLHEIFVELGILFKSENDLEFLRFFNRKLKKKGVKRAAILGENIEDLIQKWVILDQTMKDFFK